MTESSKHAAERFTAALGDLDWRPQRSHIESARNALNDAAVEAARLEGVIRAVTGALHRKRNRFGKLDVALTAETRAADESLRQYGVALGIPHGGADVVDKAVMVLRAAIGEEPRSILDEKDTK